VVDSCSCFRPRVPHFTYTHPSSLGAPSVFVHKFLQLILQRSNLNHYCPVQRSNHPAATQSCSGDGDGAPVTHWAQSGCLKPDRVACARCLAVMTGRETLSSWPGALRRSGRVKDITLVATLLCLLCSSCQAIGMVPSFATQQR
jgi:hypothetical protein